MQNQESQGVLQKWRFCQFRNIHKNASAFFMKKVAGYWLIKKRLQHSCFPVDWAKCFKNTYFEEPLQVAVTQNNTIICF